MAKQLTNRGLTALPTLMAAWALLAADGAAKADVIASFSVNPGTINAGQQSTLDLTLTATQNPLFCSLTCDYLGLTGGSVTLYSGTGLSHTFTLTTYPGPYGETVVFATGTQKTFGNPLGPDSEDFQFSFTYPTPGTYTPSYQFTADYEQSIVFQIVGLGYQVIPAPGTGSGQGSGSLAVNAVNTNPPPAGVPGPLAGAGLPGLLFVGGGLFGYWRRKRKAAAVAA